jgi:hypothetical protein
MDLILLVVLILLLGGYFGYGRTAFGSRGLVDLLVAVLVILAIVYLARGYL